HPALPRRAGDDPVGVRDLPPARLTAVGTGAANTHFRVRVNEHRGHGRFEIASGAHLIVVSLRRGLAALAVPQRETRLPRRETKTGSNLRATETVGAQREPFRRARREGAEVVGGAEPGHSSCPKVMASMWRSQRTSASTSRASVDTAAVVEFGGSRQGRNRRSTWITRRSPST